MGIHQAALSAYRTALYCSAAVVAAMFLSGGAMAIDYTGGNGAQGATGSFPNTGCVCNSGQAGGSGGANGFGGGNALAGGANRGYANSNLGGGGGGADGGGGGGAYYASGAGGSGGGAGGAGYLLTDGNTLTSSGAIKGGNGGDGGYSTPYYDINDYSQVGGGGGGGGGSGVIATGTMTLTNTGSITGGTGGTGAFANYANFNLNIFSNPSDSGSGGAGGYGVRADGATSLTLNNSGNITGGDGGYHAFAGQSAGSAGIYGQNITLTNTGGTVKGGYGNVEGAGVEFTGGSNTLNISAGTITGNYYGVGVLVDGGTNTFNISGGAISTPHGSIALQINGGTNTLNVTGGTLGAVYLAGGATTLEGTAYGNIVTLAHGATASVTSAGGDVSGITSFDNHGGLSLDAGRSLTLGAFTNESDGTLTLAAGATLVSTNLNLIAGSTITGAGSLSSGSAAYGLSSGSISAALAGTGGLTKTGSGTLTLTGANTYTGGTTVSGGTLAIAIGALGGGNVTMAQGTTIQFTGSSFTTSNNFFISGDPVFNVASGTTQTVSGVIADDTMSGVPGVVEKTGAGELVLSGANTYSGGTTLSAGKLTVGVDSVTDGMGGITSSAIGTGTLTLDGGTLSTDAFHTLYNDIAVNTAGGTIDSGASFFQVFGDIADGSGPGTLTIAGTTGGVVFLGGTNTYSGATVVNVGATLEFSSPDSLSTSSDYTVNGTLNLRELGGGPSTIKSLSGTGSVTNTLAGNSVLTIATGAGQTKTFDGQITDFGGGNPHIGIAIAGQGTQIFTNASNNYSGGTTLTSGILGIGASNVLGSGTVTFDGGTLKAEGSYGLNNAILVNGTGGTVDANQHALTLNAFADGSGVTGGTSLVIASTGGAGTVTLTGTSTYSGGVTVNTGATLVQDGSATIPGGAYTVNGGLQVANATIGGLNGSGAVQDSGSGGTLDIEIASGSAGFSGAISDSGTGADILALTKGGAGTQALSGNNTYTGGTTINAGTLVAGSSSALGSGTITVTGGTLGYANGITLANALQFQGDAALNVATGTATHSGDISDDLAPHTVSKTGAGTLVLSGTNTAATNLRLAAGTLEIASQNALGGGTFIFDGGTLKFDGDYLVHNDISVDNGGGTLDVGSHAITLSGTLSEAAGSTGALSVSGGGSVTVTGTNNLTGGSAVATGGTLTVANAFALGSGDVSMAHGSTIAFTTVSSSFSNNFVLEGDPAFNVDTGLTTTLTGVIADAPSPAAAGVVEKTGAGTLVLSGSNTYSGGTTVSAGTLIADSAQALGTGDITLDGGTLGWTFSPTVTANIALTTNGGAIRTDDNTITLGGIISDAAAGAGVLALVQGDNPGIVVLNGANTYTGGTQVGQGVSVVAGSASAFGTGAIELDGGVLTPVSSSTITLTNDITVSANGGTIQGNGTSLTVSGAISNLDPAHPGLLTFGSGGSADTSTIAVSGANTYTGGTTIAGGTVRVSGSSALGDASGAVEMQSGTTLAFASGASLANLLIVDDATPTLNVASGTGTLSGGISELSGVAGGFTKTGSGTLLLTGASGNSGATIVSAGTLEIGDGAASSSSAYQVASGATLAFDSQTLSYALVGSLAGAGTVTSVSQLEVGGAGTNSADTTFSGTITTAGLVYNGGGTLTLTGTGSSVGQLVVCSCVTSGGITLSGGSLTAAGGVGVEAGTLTVKDGVQLTTPALAQSGGTMLVDGAGTVVDATSAGAGVIQVYTDGGVASVFTVSGGAHVTSDNLLTGIISGTHAPQLTVTGTGTSLSLTGGAQLDNGTVVTVADGASLTTPSITLDHNAVLAIGAGAAAGTVGDASTTIQGLTGGTSLVANFTGASTVDALVTGSLAVNVQAGNLTLTNVLNDYSGGSTIAHGATLTVENNSMGTGAIVNNGTLAFNNSTPVTFANGLTGSGGVTQSGTGALTMNTAQVYTGRTVITGNGTLFLTGAGDLSHSSEIQADGTFDVSGVTASGVSITSLSGSGDVEIGSKTLTITNGSGVFSGILSDGGAGGSLMLTGGDEILNGVISLTGDTTIAAGTTVVVSGPNALGSGPLDFKAGSTLKFGASGTYTNPMTFAVGAPVFDVTGTTVTLSGVLAGPGDLAATGANGILTLTNAGNTYAGGTEVYGGSTLRVDADGELGGVAALQLGNTTTQGTLRYAGAFTLASGRAVTVNAGGGVIDTNGFDVTVGSAIGGSGALTKAGAGNLILTGTSALTGPTTITGGTLSVNGSLAASAVTVASGGKLGGTGTVGATSVASGGTVAPGNSIGTLHVNGNLTLASGSTTAIELSPTAADQIAVSGAAALGGTLALSPAAGTYANGTDFKLISASSVTGTFASVTGAAGLNIASSVQYSATGVDLILGTPSTGGSGSSGASGGAAATPTTTFLFGSYGTTPNQIAAGNALAAGASSGALYTTLGKLVSSSTASVPGALGQLAGEIHASMRGAMIQDGRIIRDTVMARGDQEGSAVSVWASGFGDYGSLDGNAGVSAVHHNNAGVMIGADVGLMPGLRAGIAGAYTAQKISVPGALSSATGATDHIAGYVNWNNGPILVNLGGDYGWGANQVRRQVAALAESDTNHQANQIGQVFGNAGYRLTGDGGWMAEPYVGLAYVSANTGAFAETGGLGALSGASRSDNETYSTLGVRAMLGGWALGSGISVTPRADFAWQHAFNTLTPGQTLTFIGTSQSFTVLGVPLDTDAAAIQAGLDFALMPALTFSVGYDGNIGVRDQDYAVRGSLNFQF